MNTLITENSIIIFKGSFIDIAKPNRGFNKLVNYGSGSGCLWGIDFIKHVLANPLAIDDNLLYSDKDGYSTLDCHSHSNDVCEILLVPISGVPKPLIEQSLKEINFNGYKLCYSRYKKQYTLKSKTTKFSHTFSQRPLIFNNIIITPPK
jgi:hypothetical protein